MINQDGKKIIENERTESADYLFKEIRFLEKCFHKEKNIVTAKLIAESLNKYISAKGNYMELMTLLSELESFSEKAQNEDFLWQLVYIRRAICRDQSKTSFVEMEFAANCHMQSARLFEKICECAPTLHNQHARIMEYLATVAYFENLIIFNDKFKVTVIEILSYAEKLFEGLEKQANTKYYKIGWCVYSEQHLFYYKHIPGNVNKNYDIHCKMIIHLRELYLLDNEDYYSLKMLAIAYSQIVVFPSFSYKAEKENIETTLSWLEEAISKGESQLDKVYRQVKNALKKYKYIN